MVCWGWNEYGQLGTGTTGNVGTSPDQMGSNLKAADLGEGFCSPIHTTQISGSPFLIACRCAHPALLNAFHGLVLLYLLFPALLHNKFSMSPYPAHVLFHTLSTPPCAGPIGLQESSP